MSTAYVDRSRDRRIEDPTNLWVVHPSSRALLPLAVRRGISANAVSVSGLCFGALAGLCYLGWPDWRLATLGFLLCICWLIADGLDGMVARATGTASPLGRILDGLCDHAVFGFVYIALAVSIGTLEAWAIGFAASAAHAVQSSLYEGERQRYHRRVRGDPLPTPPLPSSSRFVRAYEAVATSLDRAASRFDRHLAETADGPRVIARYRDLAAPPMKLLSLLSANSRVIAIYLACLAGDPMLFWWFELLPLSLLALAGILWHRRVEGLAAAPSGVAPKR